MNEKNTVFIEGNIIKDAMWYEGYNKGGFTRALLSVERNGQITGKKGNDMILVIAKANNSVLLIELGKKGNVLTISGELLIILYILLTFSESRGSCQIFRTKAL